MDNTTKRENSISGDLILNRIFLVNLIDNLLEHVHEPALYPC